MSLWNIWMEKQWYMRQSYFWTMRSVFFFSLLLLFFLPNYLLWVYVTYLIRGTHIHQAPLYLYSYPWIWVGLVIHLWAMETSWKTTPFVFNTFLRTTDYPSWTVIFTAAPGLCSSILLLSARTPYHQDVLPSLEAARPALTHPPPAGGWERPHLHTFTNEDWGTQLCSV